MVFEAPGRVQRKDGGEVGKRERSLRVDLPPVGQGDGGVDDDGGQAQPLRYVAPWDSQASWQNWFGGFRLLKRHPH